METAIGIILGVIATIAVSRYYFLRTVNKSLGIYELLSSVVFRGIEPDVRKQLNFRFKDIEVSDLQQLVFLVANDGERAISNILKPLNFSLPKGAVLLDASVIHRQPSTLQADLSILISNSGDMDITMDFPLLNKDEFFIVKLLVSGLVETKYLKFSILADDLPREFGLKWLPPSAYHDSTYKFEWGLALVALVICAFPAWIFYSMYTLWEVKPGIFPFPWETYQFSLPSAALLVPAVFLGGFFLLMGLIMLIASAFSGTFPPTKARFQIPKELRGIVYPYRLMHIDDEGTLEVKQADPKPSLPSS